VGGRGENRTLGGGLGGCFRERTHVTWKSLTGILPKKGGWTFNGNPISLIESRNFQTPLRPEKLIFVRRNPKTAKSEEWGMV